MRGEAGRAAWRRRPSQAPRRSGADRPPSWRERRKKEKLTCSPETINRANMYELCEGPLVTAFSLFIPPGKVGFFGRSGEGLRTKQAWEARGPCESLVLRAPEGLAGPQAPPPPPAARAPHRQAKRGWRWPQGSGEERVSTGPSKPASGGKAKGPKPPERVQPRSPRRDSPRSGQPPGARPDGRTRTRRCAHVLEHSRGTGRSSAAQAATRGSPEDVVLSATGRSPKAARCRSPPGGPSGRQGHGDGK